MNIIPLCRTEKLDMLDKIIQRNGGDYEFVHLLLITACALDLEIGKQNGGAA